MKKEKYFRLNKEETEALAKEYGTPLLVLSLEQIEKNYRLLRTHLPRVKVFYAKNFSAKYLYGFTPLLSFSGRQPRAAEALLTLQPWLFCFRLASNSSRAQAAAPFNLVFSLSKTTLLSFNTKSRSSNARPHITTKSFSPFLVM